MWTDFTTCVNCHDRVHIGDLDPDDLCPACVEFNKEGLL